MSFAAFRAQALPIGCYAGKARVYCTNVRLRVVVVVYASGRPSRVVRQAMHLPRRRVVPINGTWQRAGIFCSHSGEALTCMSAAYVRGVVMYANRTVRF